MTIDGTIYRNIRDVYHEPKTEYVLADFSLGEHGKITAKIKGVWWDLCKAAAPSSSLKAPCFRDLNKKERANGTKAANELVNPKKVKLKGTKAAKPGPKQVTPPLKSPETLQAALLILDHPVDNNLSHRESIGAPWAPGVPVAQIAPPVAIFGPDGAK